jgi:predicted transcriptional regulator
MLFTLSDEDVERVRLLSEKMGIPKSAVLRKALREMAKRELPPS